MRGALIATLWVVLLVGGAAAQYDDGAGDFTADTNFAPDIAIRRYGKTLPPERQESYDELKRSMFARSFIELYLIKNDPGNDLCRKMECFGYPTATVKFIADAIIQGRKDEELEKNYKSNARNTEIASISAFISAALSLATLFITWYKVAERK